MPFTTKSRPLSGFTIIELVVVIAIIGVLAGLLVSALFLAISTAKSVGISQEVNELAEALEHYKLEYGEYPPDFSVDDDRQKIKAINRHLARSFRYRQARFDVPGDVSGLNPKTALHFWLRGFGPDRARPLTGAGPRRAFFEFDETRLSGPSTDGARAYLSKYGQNRPYLYYHSDNYGHAMKWAVKNSVAMPYTNSGEGVFAERDKFQIISAGLDGLYGSGGSGFPGEKGWSKAGLDNITSFSQGTIESTQP